MLIPRKMRYNHMLMQETACIKYISGISILFNKQFIQFDLDNNNIFTQNVKNSNLSKEKGIQE